MDGEDPPPWGERVKPVPSQWVVKRRGSVGEPVEDSETMWKLQDNSDSSIMTAADKKLSQPERRPD